MSRRRAYALEYRKQAIGGVVLGLNARSEALKCSVQAIGNQVEQGVLDGGRHGGSPQDIVISIGLGKVVPREIW